MPRSDSVVWPGTRLVSGLGRARQKYVFVPYRELAYVRSTEARKHGNRSTTDHRSRSMEAQKYHGSMEAQKHGSTEAQRNGTTEARKHGSTEARSKDGGCQNGTCTGTSETSNSCQPWMVTKWGACSVGI